MRDPAFIVTVDTEGDNLWAAPREITVRNAAYLPRFQVLCERHGIRPVYLVNHEMATAAAFVEFGRHVVARGTGEIGMHLHAWNSPPLVPLTGDDFRYQPYLVEYPEATMRAKIRHLTALLEDTFDVKMASHRAGRWAFDRRYGALLQAEGYRVDCSVTPGIDWRSSPGAPGGRGGADYRRSPPRPHWWDGLPAGSTRADALLEVPLTVHPRTPFRTVPWAYRTPLLRRAATRLAPAHAWLYPAVTGLPLMLEAVDDLRRAGVDHLEMMLHSSELMPGGSATYRDEAAVDRLYEDLEALFERVAPWCRSMTLREFHAAFSGEADA